MLFDILKSENSRLKDYDDIYGHCIDSERAARTRPFEVYMLARTALERFINIVLSINGVEIPDDIDEKQEKGLTDNFSQTLFLIYGRGTISPRPFLLPLLQR